MYIIDRPKAELLYDVFGIFAPPTHSQNNSKGESLLVLMPYGFLLTKATQLSHKLNYY